MQVERISVLATTENELTTEMMRLSHANRGRVVTCYARFGKADIYLYSSQPTTDTPDTIQTYKYFDGFIRNGSVIAPTKRWLNRHNYIPVRS